MDYGLWLLIGLLVVIGLVFLLSGKGEKTTESDPAPAPFDAAPPDQATIAPVRVEPIAVESIAVEPIAVEPLPVEPLPIEPAAPSWPAPIPSDPIVSDPIPGSPAATAAPDTDDDLLRLKGVGPKLRSLLIELGVTRYAQIAAWTDTDLAAIDAKLGSFKGRPVRDQWIDQAKYLAAGDIAGFEAKYGKI